ncbi:MAG: disulfide bond formation protein B [Gemmatimonadales bacterium]|nr:MAG: disulfide bond formation protein B [Gemmatimonadales bacterium]
MLALPAGRRWLRRNFEGEHRGLLGLALGIATFASVGSLYLSESVGFIPCLLCWYQRIAMYPLVPVLAVGALLADRGAWRYGLPLSVIGLLIAAYHVLIQLRPGLDAGMCEAGVPCTARYLAIFGFISIPVMAGAAFLLISAILLVVWTANRDGESFDEVAPAEQPDPMG